MAVVGAVMAIVGAVTGVVGSIIASRNASAAAKRVEEQRTENINIARTEAAQKESNRLLKLKHDKGAQRSRAAAYGFTVTDSRSFQTIQQQTEKNAQKDISNIKLQFLVTRQRELFAIADAKAEAHGAKQAMMLSVITGMGQTAAAGASMYSGRTDGAPPTGSPAGFGDATGKGSFALSWGNQDLAGEDGW